MVAKGTWSLKISVALFHYSGAQFFLCWRPGFLTGRRFPRLHHCARLDFFYASQTQQNARKLSGHDCHLSPANGTIAFSLWKRSRYYPFVGKRSRVEHGPWRRNSSCISSAITAGIEGLRALEPARQIFQRQVDTPSVSARLCRLGSYLSSSNSRRCRNLVGGSGSCDLRESPGTHVDDRLFGRSPNISTLCARWRCRRGHLCVVRR